MSFIIVLPPIINLVAFLDFIDFVVVDVDVDVFNFRLWRVDTVVVLGDVGLFLSLPLMLMLWLFTLADPSDTYRFNIVNFNNFK